MIPIWQAVAMAIISGGIGCFVGMGIMAACAMAGYNDDAREDK